MTVISPDKLAHRVARIGVLSKCMRYQQEHREVIRLEVRNTYNTRREPFHDSCMLVLFVAAFGVPSKVLRL